MEKEIFISRFLELVDKLKKQYGINIWLVEVLGKRYSFVAGHKEDSFLPPEKIHLNEKYAVVSDEWWKLPEEEKDKFLEGLKTLLKNLEKGD